MGGLFGGAKKSSGPTIASGLQLQSSVYGNAIAIVYGTTRVAPNLIWYGDFVATPVSSGGKGGKGSVIGGGGKSGSSGQYQYQVAVAMALCEGPINGIGYVYVDKSITSLSSVGLGLFPGTYPQAPWGYLLGQQSVYTEEHTIPASAPYTVTLNQGANFYQDGGVYIGGNETYTNTGGSANSSGSYYTTQDSFGDLTYVFYSGDAGNGITITTAPYVVPPGYPPVSPIITQTTIPLTAPYTVVISSDGGNLAPYDEGVAANQTPLTPVSGMPISGQYSVAPGGVYTFNSAQAGKNVTINFYLFTGTQALGYNGIAYVASPAYQLGESAALPNHNFEVYGKFSNESAQSINGEEDTISPIAYTNEFGANLNAGQIAVEFYAAFIADGGVTDIEGNPFTLVASSPGYYEYTVVGPGNGTYQFSSANYGQTVNISYTASVGQDADASQVVADILTNPHYGAAFPSQYVGDLSVYQAYCIATGLMISTALTSQVPASQILQDIATATNSAWVWSNGQLTLVPYGDTTITNFGYTYTAPLTPVVSLDDDNFLKNQSPIGSASISTQDPVIRSRARPADQINSIKVSCLDRANHYNTAIIEAKDQTLIEQFKLRQSSGASTNLFCNIGSARISAQLQLQRQYVRNTYSFQLDQRYIILDPMDIISITDENLGLNNQLVRVLEVQENDDDSLSISAEDYLQGTGTAAVYNFQTGLGYTNNYNVNPGNVNLPVIWEPTDALAGELAVWMSVSGMNTALWGGCDVYISTDGQSYTDVGRIKGASRQGVLSAPLQSVTVSATGQTIDQTNTLSVNLSESNGQLLGGTQSDATNLNTLCYVDGEYIAYENSALVGANQYNLSFLVRGAYDSDISSHVTGSQFARIDNGIFEFPYAAPLIGTTVLIKFLSFNIWGGGAQQLSEVEPYTYNVVGTAYTSPLPNVTGFATAYTGYVAGTTQLIWNQVVDFRAVDYEVRQGPTWASGKFLYRTPLLQGPINGDGTYWISAHFSVPNGGPDIYSETPVDLTITGSQITQNVIASYDQASTGWLGTFTNTAITGLGLQLTGTGNILTDPDYLNTADILLYGGSVSSGTYEIPSAQRVNIGRIAACQVIITLGTEVGYSLNAVNILAVTDYLNASNILGVDLGNNTDAYAQIRLSQDGTTYGPWQNWIPGSYSAMAYDCQVVLETAHPSVLAVLTDFVFTVDVPTLVQTYTNISVASGGTSETFSSPFNGGPGGTTKPNIQVTILNASAGDDVILSSVTLSGFTIQIMNGGVGVARSVNIIAEGY